MGSKAVGSKREVNGKQPGSKPEGLDFELPELDMALPELDIELPELEDLLSGRDMPKATRRQPGRRKNAT